MTKFLNFQSYRYRQENRPYYRGVWEPIAMETFRCLPFQYERTNDEDIHIYIDNSEITDHFFGDNKITGWTTAVGSDYITTSGSNITSWAKATGGTGDYITSNNLTLVAGTRVYFYFKGTFTSGTFQFQFKYGGTPVINETSITDDYEFFYDVENSGTHTIVVTSQGATYNMSNITCYLKQTVIDLYERTGNDYVIYDGSVLFDLLSEGRGQLCIVNGKQVLYTDDCDIGCVKREFTSWTADATSGGSFTASGGQLTAMNAGAVVNSNAFNINIGDDIKVIGKIATGSSGDIINAYITDGSTADALDIATRGDLLYISGTATFDGDGYVQLECDSNLTFESVWELSLGYDDNYIKVEVGSTVDYAGIHYSDGYKQVWWKKATVRRSSTARITVIAEEPNGVEIREKVITSLSYNVRMKVTENEFNALVAAAGCDNVTITDQTGKVFTCENIEISDPTWYQGNGVVEMRFIDSINVFTLNNTDL